MDTKKNQKVAVIVWTIDPEGNKRFLLRHNKPFDGYKDEWTIVFGDIEDNEAMPEAAVREIREEFGIDISPEDALNLEYKITFQGKKGNTEIHFFGLQVVDINIKIELNEESIGYDWMKIKTVKENMQHKDEIKAFDMLEKSKN